MRRQRTDKSAPGKQPKAIGSLSVRYAELLKLREAVERTESEKPGSGVQLLATTDQSDSNDDRPLPFH